MATEFHSHSHSHLSSNNTNMKRKKSSTINHSILSSLEKCIPGETTLFRHIAKLCITFRGEGKAKALCLKTYNMKLAC